ncbi:LINE-1 reverse transcriptase homolog [Linum perenne]
MSWRQKSRDTWLALGDKNTKFFHRVANMRKRLNSFEQLKVNGWWYAGRPQIAEAAVGFYRELYSEPMKRRPFPTAVVLEQLRSSDFDDLVCDFSGEEVRGAVRNCAGEKAPGPVCFCLTFLQKCWDIVGPEITEALIDFSETGFLPKLVCNTFVCLIPKKEDVEDIKDLRPISLVGCRYKVLSKLLTERLKRVMGYLISRNQCAFIGGRQILDASLIVNEVIDVRKRSGRPGLVFKLDLEKAYDHVNWELLLTMLDKMGFLQRCIRWIRSCVTSPIFSVIINGEAKGYFKGERGLRQGDSLSPFLFNLVMEALSGMLRVVVGEGFLSGFFMDEGRQEGEMSHILYADDTVVFCEANEGQVRALVATLVCFEAVSGLRVNYHKSCMFVVGEVEDVASLAEVFGCEVASFPSTYLGLPLGVRASSKGMWDPVIATVTRRLSGWKARYLSFGGRLTLLRSVLSSLPVYFMSLFRAPISVIKKLESIRCRFLWEGSQDSRKLHLVRWSIVKAPVERGGLGVSDLRSMNTALLGKWVWRFGVERQAWWRELMVIKCGRGSSEWNVRWDGMSAVWSVWRWIVNESSRFWEFSLIDPGGGGCLFGLIVG